MVHIFVTVVVAVVVLPLLFFFPPNGSRTSACPRFAWILYQSDEKVQLFTLRKTRSEMEEAEAPGHLNSFLKPSGNIAVLVPILIESPNHLKLIGWIWLSWFFLDCALGIWGFSRCVAHIGQGAQSFGPARRFLSLAQEQGHAWKQLFVLSKKWWWWRILARVLSSSWAFWAVLGHFGQVNNSFFWYTSEYDIAYCEPTRKACCL